MATILLISTMTTLHVHTYDGVIGVPGGLCSSKPQQGTASTE